MKNKKVIQYHRRPNSAAIIFGLILFYIICFIIMYVTKSKVQTYEVQIGSLTNNANFTAIAVREETIYNSSYSGNVNYYQKEASKVKVGDTIYTVDETGRVSEILSNYKLGDENSLSSENLSTLKKTLNNFKIDYKPSEFSAVYDLKSDLNSTVLQSINENIMANLDSIVESTGSSNLFQAVCAETGGIIVYYVDEMENLSEDNITDDAFDKNKYSKNSLKSESLIVSDNPAYKLITSEQWYMLIKLSDKDIANYNLTSKNTLKIKFKKDGIVTDCGFSLIDKDGNHYGKLSLNRYMIRYATERFLDIEIVETGDSGLKIPVSAVTEQEFYVCPKEFMMSGDNSSSYGFLMEKYQSDGSTQVEFTESDIFKVTDDYVYVKTESLSENSTLIKSDSNEKFTVGKKEKLSGVYCVNTGYTEFRLVEILDKNNEYYIVKQGVSHGISVYDRILLNSSEFSDNSMIY
ncbi:MAG: HlyD family efflux transporter periplasmic adaptor subunit [Lachnospira sp.]